MRSVDGLTKVIGEDTESLLDEIQFSFWVEFSASDIEQAGNVGDLFDAVIRKTPAGPAKPACLSSVAFYRLRGCIAELSGTDRKSILPGTSLSALVPWAVRRARWEQVEIRLRLSLPRLCPSPTLFAIIFALAVSGAAYIEHAGFSSWWKAVVTGIPLTGFMWLFLLLLCGPLYRSFPRGIQSVGDLARVVVRRNYQKLATEAGGSTKAQAWLTFRELISEATGIPAASVVREMRFPEDLGID